ncbi:3-methyl-2-oxobutanoate hydroxymethyltransferase [uncultured Thiothrix sp.]|uniref:3-methyl-2-oxobutanoate hydroxymethyltransferase n=1 Tax=uncultured Thiothrix sp. TaxID=223185 RepID=UPI00261853F9|nr:3-methyl-2-oxobutanoate hydroxymethyltransferase [uncultured Thiothrix sp.]
MQQPSRLTVADLLALRGVRTFSMLRTETNEEAAAAQAAGIDLISIEIEQLENGLRHVAPTIFTFPSISYGRYQTEEQCLAAGFRALKVGGDAVYCSARTQTVRRLAEEGIPVCGHVGLIPSKATWTGGFKAVGKTLDSAKKIWEDIVALQDAGAFAAEIEVVPEAIAEAVKQRSSLFLLGMGAGSGAHAQYLFSEDVLGSNTGHIPRHAKIYANFATKLAQLQQERIEVYKQFATDVAQGIYPATEHKVASNSELAQAFNEWLDHNSH